MGREKGGQGSPWLAKETTPAPHSPHQRMPTPLLSGFCFEHSDMGTCGHSCLPRPLSQKQTELPGCSFCQLLCFQALKYQSSLKKATEAEIRSSVSTGERVRPPGPVGSGPHASPWQPPLTSKYQAWNGPSGQLGGGWARQCQQEHIGAQIAASTNSLLVPLFLLTLELLAVEGQGCRLCQRWGYSHRWPLSPVMNKTQVYSKRWDSTAPFLEITNN